MARVWGAVAQYRYRRAAGLRAGVPVGPKPWRELTALAEALGVSMADLLKDVESDEPPESEPPPLPRGRPKQDQDYDDEPEAG